MALYLISNGPMQTTAAFADVATGTTIKTLLQVKPSATIGAKIIEWGISFNGSAAATPGKVELIETDVAATVTAATANDIMKYDAAALMGAIPQLTSFKSALLLPAIRLLVKVPQRLFVILPVLSSSPRLLSSSNSSRLAANLSYKLVNLVASE
jgi:hypothetical protein